MSSAASREFETDHRNDRRYLRVIDYETHAIYRKCSVERHYAALTFITASIAT